MSDLARALLAQLDDQALDELARLLAPRMPVQTGAPAARWLRAEDAAEYAGMSRKRLYDLNSSGALPADGYDGRCPCWRRETLDAYLERGRC